LISAIERSSSEPAGFVILREPLHQKLKAILSLVTHEMAFARDVADHVIFMDGGIIVEQGAPEQVFGNPQQIRTQQFLHCYSNK
jgi:ABC-type histidine transport system ATPase subunit